MLRNACGTSTGAAISIHLPVKAVQGVSLLPLLTGGAMPANVAYRRFIRNEPRTYTTYSGTNVMGHAVRT